MSDTRLPVYVRAARRIQDGIESGIERGFQKLAPILLLLAKLSAAVLVLAVFVGASMSVIYLLVKMVKWAWEN